MIDAAPQLRAALQTRGFDAALLAGLSVQALILLAFSLFPYTFAPKEALLLALRSSGWLTTLRRLWVYPLFAAAATASPKTCGERGEEGGEERRGGAIGKERRGEEEGGKEGREKGREEARVQVVNTL